MNDPNGGISNMSTNDWDQFVEKVAEDERARKVRLLYQTDHQQLLQACRELSKQVFAGDLKPGEYQIRYTPHPRVSQFPRAIVNLQPTYVVINQEGTVMVEMLGGLDHFGVWAYPEGFPERLQAFKYGDKQLTNGLWYYDDGYDLFSDYEQEIEAMRPKGGNSRFIHWELNQLRGRLACLAAVLTTLPGK